MQRFTALFGLVMSIIFIFMGVIVQIYPPANLERLSPSMKYLVGIVLLLYGFFRLYRSYRILTHK